MIMFAIENIMYTFGTHFILCSSQIEVLLQSDSILKSVDKFAELSALYTTLETSKCHNMVKYVKDTTVYWYKNLKNKIARYFQDIS